MYLSQPSPLPSQVCESMPDDVQGVGNPCDIGHRPRDQHALKESRRPRERGANQKSR